MFHKLVPIIVILVSYLAPAGAEITLAANPASRLEVIKINQEPEPGEWRSFLQSSEEFRKSLWVYNIKRGKQLKDWYWVWRMAWIRACTTSQEKYCQDILRRALFDDALVVRADAAVKLGRRYAGTANRDVIRLLHKAAANRENYRGGKPLFIQKRIVFALHEIGGDLAIKACKAITAKNSDLASYYQRLVRF